MSVRYPGKQVESSALYCETRVTFCEIAINAQIHGIEKQIGQGALNDDTINKLIAEYRENPEFLRFKDKITIGCVGDKWYLIDGQHRMAMAARMYRENNKIDEYF